MPTRKPELRYSPFTRATDTRVLNFLRERGMVTDGDRILVAVSGGADSTAMLTALSRIREKLGVTLVAAHFNHMLRSEGEAAADEKYVARLCRTLRVPLVTGRGNAGLRAKRRRETVEEAARIMRYLFLGREARKAKATLVAVGHTMDDRAETVLLNVIRGSGLDGLGAMQAGAPWPFGRGPGVIRPLLGLRREDTERYCRESGLDPRDDPTNARLIATRNRVRHELMPVLRSFNPRVDEALARLAEAAARDTAFVDTFVDPAWRLFAGRGRNSISFRKETLLRMGEAVATRILRRAADEVAGGSASIEAEHVDQMMRALRKRDVEVTMPGRLGAVTDAQLITVYHGQRPAPTKIPETWLYAPGTTRAGPWLIEAQLVEARPARQRKVEAYVDADALGRKRVVRSRRPGDRLRPLGLGGSKKLQDIFVDAKVPEGERDQVPVVADEHGIVWVAGHCIDERAAVAGGTERVLRLRARRG